MQQPSGAGALNTTGTVGGLPTSIWFQNPQFAYQNSGTVAQNTFGALIWNNSDQVTLSGRYAYGGVYGSPFDDRYGSPYNGSFGNTFPLDTNGGSLTVRLNEAINAVVPAPSAVVLVTAAAATAGGLQWRRRRRVRTPPA